ncbi:MAG: hypothetical protein KDB88_06925, partial [Flavobacteriales bacterium]|nr:hypothetical protein [Flavobacteriales bacterium]
YKYLLWGLFAKVIGAVFFAIIYAYYYRGGDTMSYFFSSVAMGNLAIADPLAYIKVLFGDNTLENIQYFTKETGKPFDFVYYDDRTFMVVRLISPITLLTFNSFLLTTVLVASASYVGVWRCYQTFVRYYPKLMGPFAIAVLFMPSCIFWGSAILKDTFTFAGVCWYFHGVDQYFFRKANKFRSGWQIFLGLFLVITIKPYIFMAIFPVTLLWLSYNRLASIRNALIKYLFVPAVFVGLVFLSFFVLIQMGDRLDKFSLDRAMATIITTQNDMSRAEEYGANKFDIGELDGTWLNVLSKYPVATNAALFRPYLWECNSVVMYLAGLENLFLLLLAFSVLWKSRIVLFPSLIFKNPLVLLCMAFVLTYAFITGITTPNFGALVRFKIPLIPFMVAGLYIMRYLLQQRKQVMQRGGKFRFERFIDGDPLTVQQSAVVTG